MILTVENGTFAYKGGQNILSDISFTVESGELVAILGPNGVGKTTLLRCITGFLRWKSGRSTLDGRDVQSFSQQELWRKMAYVPQAKNTITSYSVEETVLLGRGSHFGMLKKPSAVDMDAANSAMEDLHISHLRSKLCSEISGGELQMVLIAKALAARPEVLILDEPESNLDFKNQLLVLDTLSTLSKSGITCLFNTHYPSNALQWADKALILDGNGTGVFGEAKKIITEENIRKYFGVNAFVGEVNVGDNMITDVIPFSISEEKND